MCSVPEETPIVFGSESNYDNHFIISKNLTYHLLVQEEILTFPVPIEKEVSKEINEKGKEIAKTISYRLQFLDGGRFKTSSLPNLLQSTAKGTDKIKCKHGPDNKKYICRITYKNYQYCL